ncbi:thaumatin-like protein 1b [Acyrthosiphon pisum]|uniref:Thaumatin-like protein n=1 Tax=Acyrthosiphon pisum TaxID=7029 RepID=A0A8R1VY19_ACYPI|nr:thaumatin-like protein 1b [Acyrthosiphon pisum]|eukprot:XP_001942572.1 PREDICTED: thaumatin-like protein 1b [Acyrthosiphon pisum]
MDFKFVIFFVQMVAVTKAHMFRITNNCPFTVWPGIQGNPGHEHLENGGFSLSPYKTHLVISSRNWTGRIWGRTKCNSKGKCETGDCGNKIQCNGIMGVPPLSLAELEFSKIDEVDFYHVSLVDGFNLPIRIRPDPFSASIINDTNCQPADCVANLNSGCPAKLAVKAADGSSVVACKSACTLFNTKSDCCQGVYTTPKTCKRSSWPKNYPAYFKSACPYAYSYPFDETSSTHTCQGNALTKYHVLFCP